MRAPLLLILVLAASDSSRADRTVPEPHDAVVRAHMHQHYDLFSAIQHLVIRNELDTTRWLARMISHVPNEVGLGRWATKSALVRARAANLAAAPGGDEACRRTAELAVACAACHVATSVTTMFGSPPPRPTAERTTDERMVLHTWAIDRLSEGVIGGVDTSWLAGLDVLARTPAPWSVLDGDRLALSRRMQQIAEQMRRQGANGDLSERGRAYGELLVTCAACHAGDRTWAR